MAAAALAEEVVKDGARGLRLNFHRGQRRAWNSTARTVAIIAGTQSGKTVFGPHWLLREIQRRGPGDYLVVTPTYPLLALKALPEFLRLFSRQLHLGTYVGSPTRKFTVSDAGSRRLFGHAEETVIYFGHANEPDSLESATVKAAWLDEAGQKRFKLGSWEAVQRRLAIHQGRALITTTPYDLGWLKQKIYDPWTAGDRSIEVVRFDSTENPAFPRAEYESARRSLPTWKFDLFYRANFTRPAGMIYDAFDEVRHKVPRFRIPDKWPRYLGLDFGGVNTAGVFFAREPATGKLFAYREYKAGRRTVAEHVAALLAGERGLPTSVGGSHSEDQWRAEFCAAGLPVLAPSISDVEVGIDRVYGMLKRDEVRVFDDLPELLAELGSYSRELDSLGQPTSRIEDKNAYHLLDAGRYILGWLPAAASAGEIGLPQGDQRSLWSQLPADVFGRPQP